VSIARCSPFLLSATYSPDCGENANIRFQGAQIPVSISIHTAIAAYVEGRGLPALAGGLFLISVAPWTLIVIMPTNRRLLDPARRGDSPGTDSLPQKWGRLHAARTAASRVSLAILAADLAGYL